MFSRRTRMEELQPDTSDYCNGYTIDIPFILPDDNGTVMEDPLKNHPLESKEDLKLLVLDHTVLEMHQICRGCLSTCNVSNMKDIFIDGSPSVAVYEKISNIKVEMENISVGMCLQCIQELAKIDKFIDRLKVSYMVLSNAAQEIKKLNKQREQSTETSKETNRFRDCEPDEIKFHKQSTRENDVFLHNDADSFSIHNGPAKKEIFSSKKSKVNLKKNKKCDQILRQTNKNNSQNKKDLALRKSKENLENLPNNELLKTDEVKEILQDVCPLCSKKFIPLIKHLRSIHSLDWNVSKCLQCSYTNTDKDKLVEHCKGCSTTESKYDNLDYLEMKELKLELSEGSEEGDVDFHLDELERDNKCLKRSKDKKYTCNKCKNISFKQYEDIEMHLKTVHSMESNCILCDQELRNSFSVLYHMMVKHGKLKCCRLCLVSFRDSRELNIHYKSEEHNTKCTVCGEQFRKRRALYEHRQRKHLNPQLENKRYKCPNCPKEFANQNNTRRHILVAHNDLRFLCDTCGQSYTTKRNLKIHIQKFHEGMQLQNKDTKKNYFFCETCGKVLKVSYKYAVAVHRAKHKGHDFVCKKCYDSFSTEEEFKRHVKELGHQVYECDKCYSQFVGEVKFKIHLKNHEAPGWNKTVKVRNLKDEFLCSYCPKKFKDKQRLNNHLTVHTNERAYKCHICNKGFKTWTHRQTHLNIHLGIKKWVCKFCGKAFTNCGTLRGHEMIHTGERPHRCPECQKGFITTTALKKHRMVHFRTHGSSYKKKIRTNVQEKDSKHEEKVEFVYKSEQMSTDSEVSNESF